MSRNKGYAVDSLIRQALDKALDKALERQSRTLEKNIELIISPIKNTLEEHHKTLYGEQGRNGVKGAVNGLTLKVRLLNIILWIFFTTGLTLTATITGAFIINRFPGLTN